MNILITGVKSEVLAKIKELVKEEEKVKTEKQIINEFLKKHTYPKWDGQSLGELTEILLEKLEERKEKENKRKYDKVDEHSDRVIRDIARRPFNEECVDQEYDREVNN